MTPVARAYGLHPEELANDVLEVESNQALRKRIAKDGYQSLEETFSEKTVGKRLTEFLNVIRCITNGRSGRKKGVRVT